MASHMKTSSSPKSSAPSKASAHAPSDTARSAPVGGAPRPKGRRHWLWAIPAGALVLVAGAYVGGALYFQTTFMPGTSLDGQDVSMRPVSEIASQVSSSLDDFEIHVSGKGLDLTVTAEQAGLARDGDAYVRDALSQENPWAWPLELSETRELTATAPVSLDRDKLASVIKPAVEQANADKNAEGHGISYSAEQAAFVLDDNSAASRLDAGLVVDAVAAAMQDGQTELSIGDECSEAGTEVQGALDRANSMVRATVTLTLGGTQVSEVTSDMIAGWIVIGDDLSVSLDSAAVEGWTRGDLSDQLDTVGKDRTYTTPDGNTYTVVGSTSNYGASTYGWSIDGTTLAQQIVESVQGDQSATIDIPCLQSAEQPSVSGGQDWGSRYIDVNLTTQHAKFFDNGAVIWETDITTGQPSLGLETPTGVWSITNKKSRATDGDINLKGPIDPATGEPEWSSHVDFWLGIVGNLVGFHNAPWQSVFGGNLYLTYQGHGCVRMSYEGAESLYNLANVGDVVVIHK